MKHECSIEVGGRAGNYDPNGGPYITGTGVAFPTMSVEKFDMGRPGVVLKFSMPTESFPMSDKSAVDIAKDILDTLGVAYKIYVWTSPEADTDDRGFKIGIAGIPIIEDATLPPGAVYMHPSTRGQLEASGNTAVHFSAGGK